MPGSARGGRSRGSPTPVQPPAAAVSMLTKRAKIISSNIDEFDWDPYNDVLDSIDKCLNNWLKLAASPCLKPKRSSEIYDCVSSLCTRLESFIDESTPVKIRDILNFIVKNASTPINDHARDALRTFHRVGAILKDIEENAPGPKVTEEISPVPIAPAIASNANKRALSPNPDSPDPESDMPAKILVLPPNYEELLRTALLHKINETTCSDLGIQPMECKTPAPADSNIEMLDTQNLAEQKESCEPTGSIPPIFIKTPPKWTSFLASINSLLETKIVAKTFGDSIKLQPKSVADFRALQNYLECNKFEFATLLFKKEKPRKVALRGLPSTIPTSEIVADLAAQGIEAHKCYNIKRRGTREPLNIFVVELLPLPNWEAVYDIKTILSIRVNFRKFVTRGPRQCHKCNRYSHSSYNCNYPPRCLKCAGAHAPADCDRDRNEPPTCCNCGNSHTANYSGCPAAPRNNPPRPKAPAGAGKRPDPASPTEEAPATDTKPAFVPRQVSYAAKVKAGPNPNPATRNSGPPASKAKIAPPEVKWPPGPSPFSSATATDSSSPAVTVSAPANAPAPLKELILQFNDLLQKMLALCASINEQYR